jgi:hypothetical protein
MEHPDLHEDVAAAYHDAEQKAWDSLARYKFLMFGYHAANCVILNRVGKLGKPNPFGNLVATANRIISEFPDLQRHKGGPA